MKDFGEYPKEIFIIFEGECSIISKNFYGVEVEVERYKS